MYNKLKLKIVIMVIIVCFTMQPYHALASIIKQETASDGTKTYYVSTPEENNLALSLIYAHMETDAKIVYSGNGKLPSSYDYLDAVTEYNYSQQSQVFNTSYGIGSYYSDSLGTQYNTSGTVTVNYNFQYYVTPEQTKYVYNKIHEAIKSNISNLHTDYQKAHWAYQWVLDSVHYDKTYSKFSAYDGLMTSGTVCAGYAALYCAITSELGLDCAYVGGTVGANNEGNHAWNIIKLDGKWYCVDTTWGDGGYGDKFFLKSKDTFESSGYGYHKSDLYKYYMNAGEVFSSTDYGDTDTSETNSIMPSVYNIEMDVLRKNILSTGEGYTFMINNPDNTPINFKSENSKIAKVDRNGKITGVNIGSTTITAYNTDLNIAQSCKIVVVSKNNNNPYLSAKKLNLHAGNKIDININNNLLGSKIKFVSSDPSVAKVKSSSGKVTAIKKGKCKLTCIITSGTAVFTLECAVKVSK